jgi:hypothetical protein
MGILNIGVELAEETKAAAKVAEETKAAAKLAEEVKAAEQAAAEAKAAEQAAAEAKAAGQTAEEIENEEKLKAAAKAGDKNAKKILDLTEEGMKPKNDKLLSECKKVLLKNPFKTLKYGGFAIGAAALTGYCVIHHTTPGGAVGKIMHDNTVGFMKESLGLGDNWQYYAVGCVIGIPTLYILLSSLAGKKNTKN